MNSKYIVFLGFFFCLVTSTFAQDFGKGIGHLIQSKEVISGQNVCLDAVMGLTSHMTKMEITYNWDPTQLEFTSVENVFLPGLQVNTDSSANGKITASWEDTDNPFTLQGLTVLTVCLDVLADNGITSLVETSNIIFENQSIDIPFSSDSGEVIITATPSTDPIIAFLGIKTDIECFSGEIGVIGGNGLFGASPYTFQWSGSPIALNNTNSILGLGAGTYGVTVTDMNGVTATKEWVVEEFDVQLTNATITNISCNGNGSDGAIDLITDGMWPPFTYLWSNGETTEDIENISTGTYTVTVTDNGGCTATGEFEIGTDSINIIEAVTTFDPECPGEFGSIYLDIDPNAGQPVEFVWSDGSTNQNLLNVLPGSYTVTISQANLCITEHTFTLHQADTITINSSITCSSFGMEDGSIGIGVNPFGSYTYNWNDGEVTSFGARNSLAPGNYSVTILNNSGCTYQYDFEIQESLNTAQWDYYSCSTDSLEFEFEPAESDHNYQWFPSKDFENDSIQNAIFLLPFIDFSLDTIPEDPWVVITASGGCTRSHGFRIIPQEFCVWPGDTDNDNTVKPIDLLNIGLENGATGNARTPMSAEWFGQASEPWGENITGTSLDLQFADCDGNGTIEAADTVVVLENLGENHLQFAPDHSSNRGGGAPLEIILPNSILPGFTQSFEIHLGETTQSVDNAHGIAFQLVIDQNLINTNSINVEADGWLNDNGQEVWDFAITESGAGLVDIVLTKSNGEGVAGFGKIANLNMKFNTFEEDNNVEFKIQNPVLINDAGEIINIEPTNSSTVLIGTLSATDDQQNFSPTTIYPNPAKDQLHIKSDVQFNNYEIYNLMGEQVRTGFTTDHPINIEELNDGMYILKLHNKEHQLSFKFNKM